MNRALIERNNALLKDLGDENKKYAMKLGSYIRTAGLFYDENEVEDLLAQIFQDIMVAQQEGESAEQYFGKKPQEAADELIKNLGKMSMKKSLKKLSKIFLTVLSGTLLTMLSFGNEVNILIILLFSFLGVIINSGFYFAIHKGIYKKLWDNNVIFIFIGMWMGILISILAYSIFFLVPIFIPQSTIEVPNLLAISIIIVIMLVELIVFSRYKESRNFRLPFLPFIWIWGILGIAMRLPNGEIWIENNEIFVIVLLILGFSFSMIFSIIALLKEKKRQEKLGGVRK